MVFINMKSFLPAVLLSLLFVSITYSEVSGKELECYKYVLGQDSESTKKCSGNDVICVTIVDIDDPKKVVAKNCGEREYVESECQEMSNVQCKPCDTDLCNDQGSAKLLRCYKRKYDQKSDSKDTCPGDDIVCVTGLDTDSNEVVFKDCGKREDVEAECQDLSNIKCKPCDTDLCNDEK